MDDKEKATLIAEAYDLPAGDIPGLQQLIVTGKR